MCFAAVRSTREGTILFPERVSRETSTPRIGRGALSFALVFVVGSLLAAGCTGVTGPKGWASPVEEGDTLLVAHRENLIAFEAGSLDERWSFPGSIGEDSEDVDPIALYGTPAITDDAIYVPGYDGTLYALDHETGEVLWLFETDGPIIGGVIADEAGIYFGSSDGHVYALNPGGSEMWAKPFETGGAVQSTPALDGDMLYVTSLDSKLYALDASSGEERWSFTTEAGLASAPIVNQATGLVYVGGFDSRLRAIDLDSHQEQWAIEAKNWFWTTPLVAGGVVYAGSLDHKVYAADAATGQSHWEDPFSVGGEVRAGPALVGGRLIVISRDGEVYGIDPEDGSSSGGSLELGSDVLADPLVVEGEDGPEVVVVTVGGDLVRIDPSTLTEIQRKPLKG
ncbi:MAG: PQQ-binding-like beta-propeller repeat protein [Dehalococcoidia bacterium]